MDGKCGQHEVDNLGGTGAIEGVDRPDSQRALSPPELSTTKSHLARNNVATQYTGDRSSTSFTMSQTVTVQSSRLTAMQRVLGVSNLLLANNVPFIAQQPQLHLQWIEETATRSHGRGGRNARQRAQAALGKQVTLGKPISIKVGQVSVDAPGSVNYGSGDFNTSSIPKIVSVVVTPLTQPRRGPHPRMITDEGWRWSCEQIVKLVIG